MYWELYQLVVVLGAGAAACVFVLRRAIPAMSLLGAALWSVAALQAQNIEVLREDGTTTVVGSAAWQYLALGVALLTLAAGVLYYAGVYPPQPSPDGDGAPTQERDVGLASPGGD